TTAYWLTAEYAAGIRADRGVAGSAGSAHAPGSALAEPARRRLALDTPTGRGDPERMPWRKDDLDVALLGAGRAIQAVAAVLLMCDPRDLGLVTQVRSPHSEAPTIYLYEAVPGGIGLSERLFKRHEELVTGARALIDACACAAGCPSCTGPRLDPEINGKALALRLLAGLDARSVVASSRGASARAGRPRGDSVAVAQ
ncbi:MAG: Zn-binding domain-containing protein, partial [Solirubrobacteraceae bacterium]